MITVWFKNNKIQILKAAALLFTIIMVLGVLHSLFFNKSDKEKIIDRVAEFENAYNKGDWESVLTCMDTKSRITYQGIIDLGSQLSEELFGFGIGSSYGDLFGMGVAVTDAKIHIKILSVDIDKDGTAVANGIIRYSDKTSRAEQATIAIPMLKEKNEWYLQYAMF